jgi:hypothetical protein
MIPATRSCDPELLKAGVLKLLANEADFLGPVYLDRLLAHEGQVPIQELQLEGGESTDFAEVVKAVAAGITFITAVINAATTISKLSGSKLSPDDVDKELDKRKVPPLPPEVTCTRREIVVFVIDSIEKR